MEAIGSTVNARELRRYRSLAGRRLQKANPAACARDGLAPHAGRDNQSGLGPPSNKSPRLRMARPTTRVSQPVRRNRTTTRIRTALLPDQTVRAKAAINVRAVSLVSPSSA